jgi:N-acetylmuramoyl-L-alanine amidase
VTLSARARRPLYPVLLVSLLAVAGCGSTADGSRPVSLPGVAPTTTGTGADAHSGAPGSVSATTGTGAGTPATGAPGSLTASGALVGKVVVLDPGHDGGNETHAAEIAKLVPQGFGVSKPCDTTGTNGDNGYPEHEFTFAVSLDVQALLQKQGITVILTRTNDTGVGPCVDQRAAIGNDAHADAAVSIHADGYDGDHGDGHGYQILEADKSVGGAGVITASHQLAAALHTTFDSESGLTPSNYAGSNGYEPRDDIAGLNLSVVPKVLVECGNMRNTGDLALEESPVGQQHMAQAIADGIISFLKANAG